MANFISFFLEEKQQTLDQFNQEALRLYKQASNLEKLPRDADGIGEQLEPLLQEKLKKLNKKYFLDERLYASMHHSIDYWDVSSLSDEDKYRCACIQRILMALIECKKKEIEDTMNTSRVQMPSAIHG